MDYLQAGVYQFHEAFNLPYSNIPCRLTTEAIERRKNLIEEEYAELVEALKAHDLVRTADAIGDLLYVVYGTAVESGIDMYEINKEIHRSNMTKVGGKKRKKDGKLMKPKTYVPPDLVPIIRRQLIKGNV
jgi:predicted HAD superfamily Cof-like phosphohydrolase